MQKRWKYISQEDFNSEDFEKIKNLTNNDLLAQLLLTRGIDTEKKAKEFLNPDNMELTSPYDFLDMEKAVERILTAVEKGEFILIHGDFDADGITSTALLSKLLTFLKANFDIYIPNRETESHGLSTKAILKLKAKNKLKLVITCDCASNDVTEINTLKSLGVETIITDHHEGGEVLPDAYAIINPKIEGKLNENLDADKINHLCDLAGVGVAFKLACAILGKIGHEEFIDELLPLVAVGTIADVVPVLGENRYLIKQGLEKISQGKNRGLTELLSSAGIKAEEGIKSETIAFQIAPRLNSTGRLETADEGYKLLVSDNGSEIDFLCSQLNNKNLLRRSLCDKIFKEALELYENSDEKNEYAIVLYKEDWHLGVIGIVASKLIERYNKPVLMMCKDPNSKENIYRCSVRSIEGINIYELLNEISDCFITFGGHKGAAGLSFDPIAHRFDEIKQKVFELAKKYSKGRDLTPTLKIDLKVKPEDVTPKLIESLSILEPCGSGNSYPVFSIEGLKFEAQQTIGQKQNHLKFTCISEKNIPFNCVFWNRKDLDIEKNSKIDIAFYPKLNTFKDEISLQLDIQDAHYEKAKKHYNIYDHRKKQNILEQVCDFVTKNTDNVYIYTQTNKTELLKSGFPEKAFENKENPKHLMFFDYPNNETSLKQIVEKINPQSLHFMKSNFEPLNLIEFMNKLLGMANYAAHKKNGEFDLNLASEKLNFSSDIIKSGLEILNELEAIKIEKIQNQTLSLEYLNQISFKEVEESENFEDFKSELNKINEFKTKLATADEKELAELIS